MTGADGACVTITETLIDFEALSQPLLLQACSDSVFEPAELKEVANVLPLPDAGEPPRADQERDVTVPLIEGEQLTVWPTVSDAGEHPSAWITGGWPGAAVRVGAFVPPEALGEALGEPLADGLPEALAVAVAVGVGVISASICSIRAAILAAIAAAEDWCSGLKRSGGAVCACRASAFGSSSRAKYATTSYKSTGICS